MGDDAAPGAGRACRRPCPRGSCRRPRNRRPRPAPAPCGKARRPAGRRFGQACRTLAGASDILPSPRSAQAVTSPSTSGPMPWRISKIAPTAVVIVAAAKHRRPATTSVAIWLLMPSSRICRATGSAASKSPSDRSDWHRRLHHRGCRRVAGQQLAGRSAPRRRSRFAGWPGAGGQIGAGEAGLGGGGHGGHGGGQGGDQGGDKGGGEVERRVRIGPFTIGPLQAGRVTGRSLSRAISAPG